MNLTSKLKGENEYLVWKEIQTGLSDISDVWWEQDQAVQDALKTLTRETFAPLVQKLGWEISEQDSSDKRELRTLAITAAAKAGHEETVKECQRRFKLFTESGDASVIPGDFIDLVFANALRYGGEAEYEQLLKIYRKPPTPQHKAGCMRALCCARDDKLLDRTIEFMNSDEVKMQDMMYFFGSLAQNPLSRRKIWLHLQDNLPTLTQRFKGNFSLGRLVQYSFDRLSTKEDEEAITKFFADKEYVFSLRSFQSLADI